MSQCSIIIVAHHSTQMLFAPVEAALRQRGLTELIIVDNGNAPDVLSRLQQRALSDPRLKVVTGHGNVGFAKGCNIGARQTESEFLLFVKQDYLLAPEALAGLVHALKTVPKAMLVGGIIQQPNGFQQRGSRYMQSLTPKREFLGMCGLAKRENMVKIPEKSHEVAAISSACMCVRASDYKKLGGLDEVFFDQLQGIDFCVRVQSIGGNVVCAPDVKITHMPHDVERLSPGETWRRAKGLVRYFNKHFAGRQLVGTLPLLSALIMFRGVFKVLFSQIAISMMQRGRRPNTMAAKRLMILAMGLSDVPLSDQLKGKVVLVTGATSQTGLCVIRRLIAAGAAVLAISRGDEIPYRHEGLRWIKGDLTDRTLHLQGYCVDIVVHCAPLWHLPPVIDLLADAEAKRIIAFSSTSVFAKLLSQNPFEKNLVEKLSNAEKLIVEKCADKKIHYTIFRPTLIYGAGLDVGITTLAKLILHYGKLYVYPPAFGRRQPVHVDDLAVAVLQAVNNESTYDKSYNLSGADVLSYREMLERLFTLMGKKLRIIESTVLPFILDVTGWVLKKPHINGEIARRMNDDLVFFHDDAKHDFNFHPRMFLSGGMKDIEGF